MDRKRPTAPSISKTVFDSDKLDPRHFLLVSYRERLAASEERAHYQNIATKILRELSDLRSRVESSPNVSKRWIWELIQNAKDVHIGGRVKVRIEVQLDGDDPHVTFRHSGQPFEIEFPTRC